MPCVSALLELGRMSRCGPSWASERIIWPFQGGKNNNSHSLVINWFNSYAFPAVCVRFASYSLTRRGKTNRTELWKGLVLLLLLIDRTLAMVWCTKSFSKKRPRTKWTPRFRSTRAMILLLTACTTGCSLRSSYIAHVSRQKMSMYMLVLSAPYMLVLSIQCSILAQCSTHAQCSTYAIAQCSMQARAECSVFHTCSCSLFHAC